MSKYVGNVTGSRGNVLRFARCRYMAYGADKRATVLVSWMPAVPFEAPEQNQLNFKVRKTES